MNYTKIEPEFVQVLNRIPDELVIPFTIFMQNGSYELKVNKQGIALKRDKCTARIFGKPNLKEVSYKMDDHCIARFKIFSKLYLKHGKKFVDDLRMQGGVLIHGQLQQMQKLSYLRMVA